VAIAQLPTHPEFIAYGCLWEEGNYPMPKNLDTCTCSKTDPIFERVQPGLPVSLG